MSDGEHEDQKGLIHRSLAILSWPLRLLTRWCRSTWSWSFWRDWPAGVKCIAVIWMLLPFPHLYEILKIWLPWIYPLLDWLGINLPARTAQPAPSQEGENQSLIDQVRTSMLVIAAWYGVFFLIWRTVLADKQTQATDKQTEINRESHYTELFTKAVEQLGAVREGQGKESEPALEIRIGAIYSLERLAKDSERDYGPIIETLAAYIREHCRDPESFDDKKLSEDELKQARQKWIDSLRKNPPVNRSDVAAVLTVLSRREQNRHWTSTSENETQPDFTGANFQNTILSAVDLSGANLEKAKLIGANLSDANLREAKLKDANLAVVDLFYADLRQAKLSGANLQEAKLVGANIEKAKLIDANLQEAELEGANLAGAELENALLVGAQLKDVKGLTDEMLEKTIGAENTLLPDGLSRPASWGSREDAIKKWETFLKGKWQAIWEGE